MLLSNPKETVSYLRLSSWFYSLIWNYRYSHVVSLVFTIVEAKCGIVSPESTAFSEDNNSDGEIEDVVETIPEPSPGVRGFSHPAFPSPEPLPQPLMSLAGLGLTKASCFVCNSFSPCTFLHTIPLILMMTRRMPPQKWKTSKSRYKMMW